MSKNVPQLGGLIINDSENTLGVNSDGSINVNVLSGGGGGGSNASVGATGSTAPTSATELGAVDTDGKLQALNIDDTGALIVTTPSGGSTAAKQDTGNTSLASIDTKTPALSSGKVPVIGPTTPSDTQPVSGTFFQATQPISAAALPLPSGAAKESGGNLDTIAGTISAGKVAVSLASTPLPTGASTAAKQPALGTAGTASADVISIQGVASMMPVKVDGSGVTQPVSGTVTANAGTNMSTASLALETGGNLAAAKADLDTLAGTVSTGKVAISVASLPLPSNAAQDGTDQTGVTPPTGAVGIRGWLSAIYNILKNSTIGVTGTFFQATQPVSIATAPVLVAGSAIVGKVGIDQTTPGTTNLVQDASDGSVAAGTAAGKSSLGGGVAATSAPSPTVGQQIAIQLDTKGNQRVVRYGHTGSFSSVTGSGAASVTLTVPANTRWVVKSIYTILNNPAGSSPLAQALLIGDAAGHTLGTFIAGTNSGGASTTTAVTWGPSCPTTTVIISNNLSVGIPELTLGPGMTILFDPISAPAGTSVTIAALIEVYPD